MRSRVAPAAVLTLVLTTALAACTKSASTSSTTSSPGAQSPAPSSIASTAPSMAGDVATFTSTHPAYSFRYPSSWKKEEGTSDHALTIYPRSGPNWVELTLDRVPSGTTLDVYKRVYRKQAAKWGFVVVAIRRATMGGRPALVIGCTSISGMSGSRTAAFLTLRRGYVYMLTLNGPADSFEADYQTVVSMARSFRFGG